MSLSCTSAIASERSLAAMTASAAFSFRSYDSAAAAAAACVHRNCFFWSTFSDRACSSSEPAAWKREFRSSSFAVAVLKALVTAPAPSACRQRPSSSREVLLAASHSPPRS